MFISEVSMEEGLSFAEENGLFFREISSSSSNNAAPVLLEDIAFELYVSKLVPNLISSHFNPYSTSNDERSTGHDVDDDPYYISKLIINKIIDNMFKCSRSLNQDFENGT